MNNYQITNINQITDIAAGIAGELIRDRTQADVDYALGLERNGGYTDEDLKGAYNISDRNRVGEAFNYMMGCLRHIGRYEALAKIKDDWVSHDIVKPGDNRKVLAALEYLKWHLPYSETEEVPDSLDVLTYQKVNTVENILFDTYGVFLRMADMWFFCGEAFASDFDFWNQFK